MHGSFSISDYKNNRHFRVSVNCSWVDIVEKGDKIYERTPHMDEWYDAKHKRIVDAMRELEMALLDTVGASY